MSYFYQIKEVFVRKMFMTIKWGQGFQKQSLKSKQNSRGFSFANNTVITF